MPLGSAQCGQPNPPLQQGAKKQLKPASAREPERSIKNINTCALCARRQRRQLPEKLSRRSLRNFSAIRRIFHRSAAMKVRWGTNREPRVVFERLLVLRRRRGGGLRRRRQPRPRRRRSHRSLRCRRRRAFAGRTARGSPKCPSPSPTDRRTDTLLSWVVNHRWR